MRIQFRCRQCGRCCRKYGEAVRAGPEDLERWRKEKREDILEHFGSGRGSGEKCPFLRKRGSSFVCAIHKTRPEVCREYPLLVNAKTLRDRLKECRGMKLVRETGDDARFWEIISEGRKVFKI